MLTARPPPPASLTSKPWEDEKPLLACPLAAAKWPGSLAPRLSSMFCQQEASETPSQGTVWEVACSW
ncbi:mCG18349 [Mus musculus]|nr:mCG18349 [Mus musculus]